MTVIYLKSNYETPSQTIRMAEETGHLRIVEQHDLTPALLLQCHGLITGGQLDQDAMMAFKDDLKAFLQRGGRWFFNGHMLRPLIDGMEQYRPIAAPKRADFNLSSLNPHPIFDGIDYTQIETNKGVAGFYGRGCNPLPKGAVTINGLGAEQVPIDWVWAVPGGGRIFSHSGNDLSAMGIEWGLAPQLTQRIIDWTAGGNCLDPWPATPNLPAAKLPLAPAESYQGHRSSKTQGRRIVAPSCGTYYHIRSLEGPRYEDVFSVICTPEELEDILRPDDILWVPCRTPAARMIAQKEIIQKHLDAGGMVIALGESLSERWLPAIDFTPTPTNWWWWLDPKADLGIEITPQAENHPLMKNIGKADVTWHLHGWFVPPQGAEVLAHDHGGRAILYEDRVSTKGTMIISSLDPIYHHGSHFMPATTRFLDQFVANLKEFSHV